MPTNSSRDVRLTHPTIIQFFDFGELKDGTRVIVMEYIEGRSLAAELSQGPLAPHRADRIFTQICGALAEAHANGIVHRDLKPDNILLTERGGQRDFVKVLDFGIAKISAAEDDKSTKLTQQGMMVGTPPYMSPEQFSAEHIDARSDIYSLGVIAYEMLTGKLPFMAKTPWEWASKHLTAEPEPLEVNESHGISQRRVYAIRRALAKSRDDRQQSVVDLLNDFTGVGPQSATTAAMAQQPAFSTPAVRPTPVQPTPVHASSAGGAGSRQPSMHDDADGSVVLPTSRPPWGWVLGAVALIALGATGAFVLTRGESTVPSPPPAPVAAAVVAPPVPQPPVAQPPHDSQPVEPRPRADAPAPSEPSGADKAPALPTAPAARTHDRPRDHGRDRPSLPQPRDTGAPSRPASQEPAAQPVVAATPQPSEPSKKPVRVLEPRTVSTAVPPELQERLRRANADAIDHVEQAITQYQLIARKFGDDAPGVKPLKSTISSRGEQRLKELLADDHCAQAQALYRALAGIGAAPPKERHFGKSCKAP